MKKTLALLTLLVYSNSFLAAPPLSKADEANPIIYVSIVSHNEEPNGTTHPDFLADEQTYAAYRQGAVDFAEMIYEEGAKYNFQSDWNFLLAEEENWENYAEETNGKNLLRYLEEDLGFAVDPHAHESRYSIADVAYLMTQMGITPSNIVGGFIADPAEDSRVEDFQVAIDGWQYDTSWKAEALWGAATGLHSDDSDLHISGIWRPQDNDHFTTDDSSKIPVIGGYTSDWDGLEDLLEKRAAGELDPDEMYTVTLMNNQEDFIDEDTIEAFRAKLQDYADETEEGTIQWVTLEEALSIWENDYDENPNLYSYEEGSLTEEDGNSSTNSGTTSFTDIEGHWAEEVITLFYERGVIQGKTSTSFGPNDSMTRAELLKVALLAAGYDPDASESTSAFSDVSEDDWFMPYVAYAYKNGFIEGYSDGRFKPNDSINRAEALTILLRVAGADVDALGSGQDQEEFSDVSKEDWFYTYITYARNNGIVEGYTDGSFGPANQVTRAEFVTMAGREFL